MASNPRKGQLVSKLAAAQQEIKQLRAALGVNKPTTEELWGAHAPQEMRDQMAASALIFEKLDEPRALIRLGFHCEYRENTFFWKPEVYDLAQRIFGTPGVQEVLARDMEDAERNRAKIIARLVQTSMHGTDGESTRAAQQLSKMAGWNEGGKNHSLPPNITFNLMQMIGEGRNGTARATVDEDPDRIIDADEFLVHEPGEATLVSDEEPQALAH